MSTISITDTISFMDMVGGPGIRPTTLNIVVQNRNGVTQQTLGPYTGSPLGDGAVVTESDAGSPDGISYAIALDLDDVTYDYPGDFVILRFTATLGTDTFPEAVHTVNFPASVTLTYPTGMDPYGTVAEADAYFQLTLKAEDWNGFSETDKGRALFEASNDIDSEQYQGYKNALTSVNNRRQFPRIFDSFTGLFNLDTDGMPELVKEACYEQARFLLVMQRGGHDPNQRRDLQQFGVTSVGHGRSQESWEIGMAANDRLCASAREKLRPFLATTVPFGHEI